MLAALLGPSQESDAHFPGEVCQQHQEQQTPSAPSPQDGRCSSPAGRGGDYPGPLAFPAWNTGRYLLTGCRARLLLHSNISALKTFKGLQLARCSCTWHRV